MPADFLQSFMRRYSKYWLLALVTGAIVGGVVANNLRPTYEGSLSVTFPASQAVNQQEVPFYLYDNFYALEAGNQEKVNYLHWIGTPSTIQAIYRQAGLEYPDDPATSVFRTFTPVSTETSNTATVTIRRSSADEATRLTTALREVSTRFPTTADTVIVSEPVVTPVVPPTTLVTIATALAFLLFAFLVTFFLDFFSAKPRRVHRD